MRPVPAAIDAGLVCVFIALFREGITNRERPGAVAITLVWLSLAGVSVLLVGSRVDAVPGVFALGGMLVGWTVSIPLWIGFVVGYTGRGPTVTPKRMGGAAVSIGVLIVGTLWGAQIDGIAGQLLRIGVSIGQTTLIGIGLFAVFLVVRSTVTYDDLGRRPGTTLSVGGLGVSLLLFSISTVSATDPNALPASITGTLTVTAGSFAICVYLLNLFDSTPGTGHLARSVVFDEMSEAVFVLDREGRFVDANEAAEEAFGVSVARDAGKPANTVLGWDPEAAGDEPRAISTERGRRRYEVSESVLSKERERSVGTVYVCRDVTDERTREQRLEVLHRILRHNLRNDLDAIRGFSEVVSNDQPDESAAAADRIGSVADDLVELGETIERADQVISKDVLEPRPIDPTPLFEDVVGDIRETYDCRIDVSVSDDVHSLFTDDVVLRTAIREAVENGVEHSESDVPTVKIEVSRIVDGIRIAISDDGPGIPDRERAVLLDGAETPLKHGSGVGLWLVSWAVTRLRGELSFEAASNSGSTVIIELPDRSPPDSVTYGEQIPS